MVSGSVLSSLSELIKSPHRMKVTHCVSMLLSLRKLKYADVFENKA